MLCKVWIGREECIAGMITCDSNDDNDNNNNNDYDDNNTSKRRSKERCSVY